MAKAAADYGRFVPLGTSPFASRRAAVLLETPQTVAARRTVRPASASDDRRVTLGRPSLCPCALARANPARTRSRTRSRSNSAMAPRTWSCRRPAGVVVSIPSFRETNPTPTAVSSSSSRIRWRRLRPSRAVARNETTRAIELLQANVPYERAIPPPAFNFFFGSLYPVYVRAQAYAANGQHQQAVAEFQKILDHRGLMMGDPAGARALLDKARSLARAGDQRAHEPRIRNSCCCGRTLTPMWPFWRRRRQSTRS